MSADWLEDLVRRALTEDVGSGDITAAALVPADATGTATISQKAAGVLFGLDAAAEAFEQAGAGELERLASEGEWRSDVPIQVARVRGNARALLAAERVALNFLGHLSGISTLTARFVRSVSGTEAVILDTRKTTPGLRALEKAAVVAGGGENHRMGLADAALIKENHVVFAGGMGAAVELARERLTDGYEVECGTQEEVAAALAGGAVRLLLDNMAPEELREAVAARDRSAEEGHGRATLEASGGVTLENVTDVAAAGVDYISVGALTHSAAALDLSVLIEPA